MFFLPILLSIFIKYPTAKIIFRKWVIGPILTALFLMAPTSFAKAEIAFEQPATVLRVPQIEIEISDDQSLRIKTSTPKKKESLADLFYTLQKELDKIISQRWEESEFSAANVDAPANQIESINKLAQSLQEIFVLWKTCSEDINFESSMDKSDLSPSEGPLPNSIKDRFYQALTVGEKSSAFSEENTIPSKEEYSSTDVDLKLYQTQSIFLSMSGGIDLFHCSPKVPPTDPPKISIVDTK